METKQSIAYKLSQEKNIAVLDTGAAFNSTVASLTTVGVASLSTTQLSNLTTTQLSGLCTNMDLVITALKKIDVL
jgi:hypothetical protein